MEKLKIYIDTCVISHLQHEDAPERTKKTLMFWEELKTGKYEIFISDVTLQEIENCHQPKRTDLFNYLEDIEYEVLPENDDVWALAKAYIENGILTQKRINDCMHIAHATINKCNVVVSWNFKHMLRLRTIQGVRAVNAQHGYSEPIDIIQPTMIGSEEDEEA
jgi:predicted nucleic acid-binding protein